MYGGDGESGDNGVPSAGGVIGLIGVPAALKGAVELAFIISDGNILGAGAGLFSKGVGKVATAAGLRRVVAKNARSAAAKEARNAIKFIRANKEYAATWKALSKQEQAAVARRLRWQFQQRYFDAYFDAAKKAKRDAKKLMRKKKHRAKGREQLRAAEMAEEAAAVKPVAGRLPANQ